MYVTITERRAAGRCSFRPPQRTFAIKLLFATGPSINTRLLIAVLASIALLIMDQKTRHLESLRNTLSLLTDPVKYLVDMPVSLVRQATESVNSYAALKKENASLREEHLMQQTRLLKLEALEKENIRLRALLENSFKLGEQVMIAELLSIKMAPYEHIVVINKGTNFDVHPQQPVIDENGVVGQVIRALPLTSEVMLITDPNHAVPVQVNRNGLLTIAVGSGQKNRLILPFLPNDADIQPGDLLITSGLGGVFPQGYPVAVVDKFTSESDKPFATVTATPKAFLERSRELMIVESSTNPIPLVSKQAAEQNEVLEDALE